MQVSLHVNGRPVTWETTLSQTLADALREHGCTSVKCGCEQGTCGMCTVWLDGKPVLSCSLLLCRLSGREVTTVEGVEPQARVLASYLVAEGGDQCGFCAPGYMMTILAMGEGGLRTCFRGDGAGVSGRKPLPVHRLPQQAAGGGQIPEPFGKRHCLKAPTHV